jgi:Uma2 family endonuclease
MGYAAFDYLSPDDYLNLEVRRTEKHEYFDGRIYDMAGAGLNHNFIFSNLFGKISAFPDGKNCDVFGPDLRITTPSFDSYMYPDLSIICNGVTLQQNSFDTATNPSVLIEIMGSSTRGYDMAFKFHYYKQIPSLQEYILVDLTWHFVQINRRKNESYGKGLLISKTKICLL